jgi:hypothetical protein
MAFKPKQLKPDSIKPFAATEVETLLEDIDNKLDLILEGQIAFRDNLSAVKGDTQRLYKRVERTELRLDAIDAR